MRIVLLCLSSAITLVSVGCGVGTLAPASSATMNLRITGRVFGGQSPVVGAHVHVFQSVPVGAGSGRSVDLIQYGQSAGVANSVSTSDSLGYYVPTSSSGTFSLTGDYECDGSGPVYLLATQGNPGLPASGSTIPNNAALALLAVLADACGSGSTLSSGLVVNINELSTVAGVYALAGYLSGPNVLLYPGTSVTPPQGLTNGADTAMALVNMPTGSVNAITVAGGTVPAAAITTLANIVAACVNSSGSTASGSPCGTLFNNATSNGVPVGSAGAGTAPTDTVTALLNIAHNTGVLAQSSAAMSALYGLAPATPPFAGGLTAQPNDWSLSVAFAPVGLGSPGIPAVDAAGNVWFAGTTAGSGARTACCSVARLSPLGASLAGYSIGIPASMVAIDPSNNGWIAFPTNGAVVKAVVGSGATQYNVTGSIGTDNDHQIAIDTNGNVYLSDFTNGKCMG